MMEKFRIDNILKVTQIDDELELEQAISVLSKLRLLVKEDISLKPLRKHLADLIEAYEAEHWTDEKKITQQQLASSHYAEKTVQLQNRFIQRRKELIKAKLKQKGLLQNDLAAILGHRKNYMSELINGLRPLSQEDIIIIHKILGIKLDDLIIPVIKEPAAHRIQMVIKKLNKPQVKWKAGFDFNLAP